MALITWHTLLQLIISIQLLYNSIDSKQSLLWHSTSKADTKGSFFLFFFFVCYQNNQRTRYDRHVLTETADSAHEHTINES